MLALPHRRALLSGGFTPRDVPSLAGWYRYGVGITSSGGAVSQWDDQSSKARHAKQSTGSSQPALQSDSALLFDGIDDFLQTDPFPFVQPEGIYVLGQWVTWTSNDCMFGGGTTSTGSIQQTIGTPQQRAFAGVGLGTVSPPLNTDAVHWVVFNGASSRLGYNNNAPVSGNAGSSNMGGFTMGSNDGAVQFGNFRAKEVVLLAADPDAATHARLIAYLARVGGLSI